MTVEKVSAGQAMQRPQQIQAPKALPSQETERLSETQLPVGGAPGFDHAAGIAGTAGRRDAGKPGGTAVHTGRQGVQR